MMTTELLLTSFAPWRKHQRSNASDDLLVGLQGRGLPQSVVLLRQLPVNLPVAKDIAIAKLRQLQPKILVLCGMAESRSRLSLEQQATIRGRTHQTSIDLDGLVADLKMTEISQDAGRFVCNSLYYSMLNEAANELHKNPRNNPDEGSVCPCLFAHVLFVHVPVLTEENRSLILADMSLILDRLLIQTKNKDFSQFASRVAD